MSPHRQIEAIALLGRYLWQDHSIDELVQEAARLAVEGTRADAALVLERTVGNRLSTARASLGWAEPPGIRDLTLGTGWHGPAVLEAPGVVAIIDDLRDRPEEPPVFAARGFRAAAATLIGDPARPFGVLGVYSRTRGALDTGIVPFLSSLATTLGLAIRRAQLTAELNREREERFRLGSLVEGSDDAIVTATLHGTILSWNPGAERLYGYAAHEIVGQDVSVLVPAERDPDRQRLLERVCAGERIPAFDAGHRRKDGSPVTVSLSLSPVRGREGEIVALAGIAHDVTETRRLESHLRQSAKMEAVGRLAGGVAHDFNNMLTVIDGYSELALLKLPGDSPVRSLVEEIHKAGERAAELTRQLMAFSRKSMAEPQVLDLSEVVEATVTTLTRIIGEDVRIETRLAPDLRNVMADRSQLDQVLFNLIINARDAMPLGGTITIETANVEFDSAHGVGPREVPPGQYVLLAVTDTGVGMDAATRARIFEPFFTTKGSGRGTGLGLAMVQNFVVQSGGHLAVYSEPGHGSAFKLYLPTVTLPVAATRSESAADAPAGTETILVVEDDDAVRVFTEAVLNAAGYEVLAASNGAEALERAQATSTAIHLLMSDVVMPVLGGHALAEQMRSIHPEARVLFTSGYTPDAVSRKGIAIPPRYFLQKPYSPAALCRKVRGVLDQ
ncbi:MAG: PAS domain S-box protein [Acidobacteria bacterium]|nr:PAS domain S-box protein [Acidobacteriota bacterium]